MASPYIELQAPVELIVGGRLVVLATREARPVPDDDLCPTSPAPRAFLGNDPRIRISGPRAATG